MRKTVFDLVWGCGAVFWAAVCWQARTLSVGYNGWTTRLRSRYGTPPAPQMLATNTRIMTWIIRIAASWFGLLSALALLMSMVSR